MVLSSGKRGRGGTSVALHASPQLLSAPVTSQTKRTCVRQDIPAVGGVSNSISTSSSSVPASLTSTTLVVPESLVPGRSSDPGD